MSILNKTVGKAFGSSGLAKVLNRMGEKADRMGNDASLILFINSISMHKDASIIPIFKDGEYAGVDLMFSGDTGSLTLCSDTGKVRMISPNGKEEQIDLHPTVRNALHTWGMMKVM